MTVADTLAVSLSNLVFHQIGYTPPTGWWVALGTASMLSSGVPAPVNELSGGGYVRQSVAWTTPASTTGQVQNTADILFPKATVDHGTVKYVAICSTSTTGTGYLYEGALADPWLPYPLGSQVKILAGRLRAIA